MPLHLQTIFIQRVKVTARTWHRNSCKSLQLFKTLATTSEGCLYKSQKSSDFLLGITLLSADRILLDELLPQWSMCPGVTFMHSPHPVNQSTGLVTRVYIKCPSCDGPEDCHTRGRQESALPIRVDTTPYTHTCVGDPHQFAL